MYKRDERDGSEECGERERKDMMYPVFVAREIRNCRAVDVCQCLSL